MLGGVLVSCQWAFVGRPSKSRLLFVCRRICLHLAIELEWPGELPDNRTFVFSCLHISNHLIVITLRPKTGDTLAFHHMVGTLLPATGGIVGNYAHYLPINSKQVYTIRGGGMRHLYHISIASKLVGDATFDSTHISRIIYSWFWCQAIAFE